jgi:hypothetical protein
VKFRTSVTLLDSYRYYRDAEFHTEESEQRALDELILRIHGERIPPNEAMMRGTAWHKVLEEPHEHYDADNDLYVADGFAFDAVTTGVILMDLPSGRVPEVKMTLEVGPLLLVGIADYLDGTIGGDFKLTKKVEPDKYKDSCQWKAYLRMMDGRLFRYHVAQPRANRKTGVITLHDYKTFTFYRTPETDIQLERLCYDFWAFAQPYIEQQNDQVAEQQQQDACAIND